MPGVEQYGTQALRQEGWYFVAIDAETDVDVSQNDQHRGHTAQHIDPGQPVCAVKNGAVPRCDSHAASGFL
jgi:hypothetical protein